MEANEPSPHSFRLSELPAEANVRGQYEQETELMALSYPFGL